MKIKKKNLKLIKKRIIIKKKIKIKTSNKHHLLINKNNNYLNFKYLNKINKNKIKKYL
ncbi:putative ribosomal protein L35 [Candidatus Carsonella ruddii HT isolate Thao2000]|uniref:Putative ribosomal protein L35 n=1 Tax=Candidatus Carsonella ruddii HT isolate Thao2000 TaxID=1202539 RepID=J3TEG6_CARRU|nr:putative ribosomal protein L35 [Candidatus Carsonella ruddii HT isolate Thao2000]